MSLNYIKQVCALQDGEDSSGGVLGCEAVLWTFWNTMRHPSSEWRLCLAGCRYGFLDVCQKIYLCL